MEKKLIGRFNHRVMRMKDDGTYKLVVVYYDLDGKPTDYTDPSLCSDIDGLFMDTVESLEAFVRPVIDEEEIDFSRSVLEREDMMIGAVYQEKLED